ncbi:hypothetical protein GCM10027448_12420 [Nocardioides dilutus]
MLLVFVAVTVLTLMLLAGHGPWAGQVILEFDSGHGLNSGDLLPLVLWAGSALACLVLWRTRD